MVKYFWHIVTAALMFGIWYILFDAFASGAF